MKVKTKKDSRVRRHLRLRNKIHGTAECPRLCVFVSNRQVYAQVVDDDTGKTIFSVSSLQGDEAKGNVTAEKTARIGRMIGERAKEFQLSRVVFDRGGFAYGKRMKALADAAREAGLSF